jgi:hypothetical protein
MGMPSITIHVTAPPGRPWRVRKDRTPRSARDFATPWLLQRREPAGNYVTLIRMATFRDAVAVLDEFRIAADRRSSRSERDLAWKVIFGLLCAGPPGSIPRRRNCTSTAADGRSDRKDTR